MEYPNQKVWGAHTNLRSINPLLLVHLNSVYSESYCRVPPPAVVISVFSWAAQRWSSGICNRRILKGLWQLENMSTTICWMPVALFLYILQAYFQTEEYFYTRTAVLQPNPFPLDLPSEKRREVVCSHSEGVDCLSHSEGVYLLNPFHPSFRKWQPCETAAGSQKALPSKCVLSMRCQLTVTVMS